MTDTTEEILSMLRFIEEQLGISQADERYKLVRSLMHQLANMEDHELMRLTIVLTTTKLFEISKSYE